MTEKQAELVKRIRRELSEFCVMTTVNPTIAKAVLAEIGRLVKELTKETDHA